MYKILITGQRSYIVGEADVVKGGRKIEFNYASGKTVNVVLAAGKDVYQVTDRCGKMLETCLDVNIIEKIKDKNTGENKKTEFVQVPSQEDTSKLVEDLKKALTEIERLKALVEPKAKNTKR